MDFPFWATVTPLAFGVGISGCVAGFVFALLLAQRARSLSINRIRPLMIAGWGTIAGFLAVAATNFGLLTLLGTRTRVEWVLVSGGICAIASRGVATGVLTIAKRAPAFPGEQKGSNYYLERTASASDAFNHLAADAFGIQRSD